jgi:hypothetical protein
LTISAAYWWSRDTSNVTLSPASYFLQVVGVLPSGKSKMLLGCLHQVLAVGIQSILLLAVGYGLELVPVGVLSAATMSGQDSSLRPDTDPTVPYAILLLTCIVLTRFISERIPTQWLDTTTQSRSGRVECK